jgi:outer membrane protein assembly factor BamB
VADGKVFTLNTQAEIQAFDMQTGKRLWKRDVIKQGEDEVVIGGGLAFSGDRVFVTAGFNEVLALNPDNGDILWRSQTKSPIRAAPSAIPGRVFVTTMDNQTFALNAENGQRLWSHRGLDSDAGILGAATPAITRDAVFTTYSSGEIYALQIDTGMELWMQNLSPLARIAGRTMLSDIRALPIFDNGVVYTTSLSNRMSAIDARTGTALWQIPVGSANTPWVSGNRIFIVDTNGTLLSINRENGNVVWQNALPRYEDPDDREDLISWQGPVLAGGRLLVFGSNGEVQEHSPVNGDTIRTWDAGGEVKLPAAVASETLFILNEDGRVSAWK